MKTAILLGSSRSQGNTAQFAKAVGNKLDADYYDLNDYQIGVYDYNNANASDDFQPLMDTLLRYERLVLASPVYWYSASAQMKVFLDRLTDLLEFNKDKGRLLRLKKAVLLATGHNQSAPACFEQMFASTFHYLGMDYQGMLYRGIEDLAKGETLQRIDVSALEV
jgi:multimeric flavodoxin WrbA